MASESGFGLKDHKSCQSQLSCHDPNGFWIQTPRWHLVWSSTFWHQHFGWFFPSCCLRYSCFPRWRTSVTICLCQSRLLGMNCPVQVVTRHHNGSRCSGSQGGKAAWWFLRSSTPSSLPPNRQPPPVIVLSVCAFSGLSHNGDHAVCSPFRLASFTWQWLLRFFCVFPWLGTSIPF